MLLSNNLHVNVISLLRLEENFKGFFVTQNLTREIGSNQIYIVYFNFPVWANWKKLHSTTHPLKRKKWVNLKKSDFFGVIVSLLHLVILKSVENMMQGEWMNEISPVLVRKKVFFKSKFIQMDNFWF